MAEIYVSKTGNDDTGDGSSGDPYLTIAKALDEVSEGDTVILGEGEWDTGMDLWSNNTDNPFIATQDVPSDITVKGQGPDKTFISRVVTGLALQYVVVIGHQSTIEDLTIMCKRPNTASGTYGCINSPTLLATHLSGNSTSELEDYRDDNIQTLNNVHCIYEDNKIARGAIGINITFSVVNINNCVIQGCEEAILLPNTDYSVFPLSITIVNATDTQFFLAFTEIAADSGATVAINGIRNMAGVVNLSRCLFYILGTGISRDSEVQVDFNIRGIWTHTNATTTIDECIFHIIMTGKDSGSVFVMGAAATGQGAASTCTATNCQFILHTINKPDDTILFRGTDGDSGNVMDIEDSRFYLLGTFGDAYDDVANFEDTLDNGTLTYSDCVVFSGVDAFNELIYPTTAGRVTAAQITGE